MYDSRYNSTSIDSEMDTRGYYIDSANLYLSSLNARLLIDQSVPRSAVADLFRRLPPQSALCVGTRQLVIQSICFS